MEENPQGSGEAIPSGTDVAEIHALGEYALIKLERKTLQPSDSSGEFSVGGAVTACVGGPFYLYHKGKFTTTSDVQRIRVLPDGSIWIWTLHSLYQMTVDPSAKPAEVVKQTRTTWQKLKGLLGY